MRTRFSGSHRLLAVLLVAAMLVSTIPFAILTAAAEVTDAVYDKVSDKSTMDGWKNYFGSQVLTTTNAGGVWTDKSVFTDDSEFKDFGVNLDGDNSFLVSLSAIASNATVSGKTKIPTDTIFVLDVSNSMSSDDGNGLSDEMVDAANESIAALLSANKNNRVGVVLYSGTYYEYNDVAAQIILPLGRYTTGSDGEYLTHNLNWTWGGSIEYVGVSSSVVIEGTTNRPSSSYRRVDDATYIQAGLALAMEQFTAEANSPVIEDDKIGTVNRMPIMVLMSDGAPTYGTTNFADPGDYNLGNGGSDSSNSAALGFVTQLTCAYAKEKIEEKYNTGCQFYTLGLGVGDNETAIGVLNPEESSVAENSFWNLYNNATVGDKVVVRSGSRFQSERSVTKISTELTQNYVDEYFSVDGSSSDLAAGLKQAFADIVNAIQLKSRYFPTLVSEDEELSGYISFVDKIGKYMSVTDIKGILIEDILFSGDKLSSNFTDGGGNLGPIDSPTALGYEFVDAVRARIGIDRETAQSLIRLAYENGQLSYDSATGEFSNYIGWYANADGEFLGFWHEGTTTMPDPEDESLTDATRPAYIIRSYCYLGEVDDVHGTTDTDMMYATVQIREKIGTDDETIVFTVPAALIPIVSYNITLDENDVFESLSVTGADAPIALLYEVALDSNINAITIDEVVGSEYAHINENGDYEFFTNRWEHENVTGYGTVNTYSYFNPAKENERYYYVKDSVIYSDKEGTVYESETAPYTRGDFYAAYTVYGVDGSENLVYEKISSTSIANAKYHEDGYWYIPAGTVRTNTEDYIIYKETNPTGALTEDFGDNDPSNDKGIANVPFVDITGHAVDDSGYHFYVGATLGNNGKITVSPETGLKISKTVTVENADADTDTFEFVIKSSDANENATYEALLVSGDGTETDSSVSFKNGVAKVYLKADDSLYIIGMNPGSAYTVTETETVYYYTTSANGVQNSNSVDVEIVDNKFANASFVNTERGTGNFTVTKKVSHDFGVDYVIPADKVFTMTVTLTGIGTASKTFDAIHSGDKAVTSVTTDANGVFTVVLRDGDQLEVFGLPEGTAVSVVESAPGEGFEASYWDNGVEGDGNVVVTRESAAYVLVSNDYTAKEVYPVEIFVSGDKILSGRDWHEDDVFSFLLQTWDDESRAWVDLEEVQVKGSSKDKSFAFHNAFEEMRYTEQGTYYYRVYEIIPAEGALGGITYDRTVHSFGVVVTDKDMDGALEISEIIPYGDSVGVEASEDNWFVSADFENTYSATGSATVTIDLNKVVKNVSNSPAVGLAGFSFGLYDAEGNLVYTSNKTTDRGFARLVMTYTELGTYEYTLKEILPETIPAGWTYSTEEIPVTVVIGDDGEGNLTSIIYKGDGALDGATDSIEATFTNTYDPTDATLTIDVHKDLVGRDLIEGEFSFAIIPDGATAAIAVGSNDADGNVTFDKALTFDKVGTYTYDIIETSGDGNGVTSDKNAKRVIVTVTDVDGALVATYTVVNSAINEVVFTNVYDAADTECVISGNKVLNGKNLLNDEFTFVLSESDAEGTIAEGARKWTTKNFADGTFAFEKLVFSASGEYYYVVSEAVGDTTTGIYYDNTKYLVKITVVDDGVGSLVVESVDYRVLNGNAVDSIEFVNNYIPAPVSTQISGNKELTGKDIKEGQFTFILTECSEFGVVAPDARTWTAKNDANGNFVFDSIEFTSAGEYYFSVVELGAGNTVDGITYDDTIYMAVVTVTDNHKGKLTASVLATDIYGVPMSGLYFNNTYDIVEYAEIVIDGDKTLTGRDINEGEFTFVLYDATGVELDRTTNDATGSFEFDLQIIKEPGNYTFFVEEVNNGLGGISYDTSVYTVTVTIEDNGVGGVIETGRVYSVGGEACEGIVFENVYTTTDYDLEISGNKELSGRDMIEGEFEFVLKDSEGNTIDSANNDINGAFTLGTTITEAGEYVYTIVESDNGHGGVSYDTTVYTVTVIISDNKAGELVLTSITIDGEGEIKFENSYNTNDYEFTVNGDKILNGRDMVESEFEFVLKDSDGVIIDNAFNNLDGKFTLGATITAAGEYTYTVVEINNGLGGISYDETVYTVAITVEDDGVGNLVETARTISGEKIVFVNTYEAADYEFTVDGDKTLIGRDKNEGEFEFVLSDSEGAVLDTCVNGADGSFTLGTVITEAGEYTFTVTETNNGLGGVSYDTTVYTVTVTVEDDGQGNLVETDRIVNADNIVFTNYYDADAYTFTVDGSKNLVGRDMAAGEFEFVLKDSTGAVVSSAKNDANGEFVLTTTISEVGEYTFTVSEFHNYLGGVIYDDAVYTVTVIVADNGIGQLYEASREVDGEIVFENNYDAADYEFTVEGDKELIGRDMIEGEFEFVLVDADGNIIDTANNDANGAFVLESVITAAGEYTFTVVETNNALGGVSYDETVYTVVITVEDDGMGQLIETSRTIDGDGAVEFSNSYSASDAEIVIEADKDLAGRDIVEGEFEFAVTDAEGNVVATAINGADGKVVFNFKVSEAGTYVYTVSEIAGNAKGITYDSAVYTVTVVVEDNGLGELVWEITEIVKAEEAVEKIAFANAFTPELPPATGDNFYTWVMLLFISAAAFVSVAMISKKRREQE